MTKLTEEALGKELQRLEFLCSEPLTRVRAHIAALEAELAEQKDLNRRLVDEQCALTARAEQAERERDEARRISRDMGAIISDTMAALGGEPDDNMIGLARSLRRERDEALIGRRNAEGALREATERNVELLARCERAEADNAALLESLRAACDPHASASCSARCTCAVEALIAADHPGAAMLELASLVRHYQRRDEETLADTFQRLMTERARITEMVAPEVHEKALERMRRLEADLKEYEDGVQRFNEALGEERRKQDERLRALERVREAVGDVRAGVSRAYAFRDFERLQDACAAADALKD